MIIFLCNCKQAIRYILLNNSLFTIFLSGVQEVPRLTRLLALWSLSTSGMVKPQAVEPLFYSIFANPAEVKISWNYLTIFYICFHKI